jgi:hypothetical protein
MENAQSEEEGDLADTKQTGHHGAVLSESNFLLKQYKYSININKQTLRCMGCSTNTFLIHLSLIHPFPPNLKNAFTPKR